MAYEFRFKRNGGLFGCKWLPWGSPARGLLAALWCPASCRVASCSCSSPPPPLSPFGGGARVAYQIYAPSAWSALYGPFPSVLRRGSFKGPASPQGVDHKASKLAKAITGPVIGCRFIYSPDDMERSRILSFCFFFALREVGLHSHARVSGCPCCASILFHTCSACCALVSWLLREASSCSPLAEHAHCRAFRYASM